MMLPCLSTKCSKISTIPDRTVLFGGRTDSVAVRDVWRDSDWDVQEEEEEEQGH